MLTFWINQHELDRNIIHFSEYMSELKFDGCLSQNAKPKETFVFGNCEDENDFRVTNEEKCS